VNIEHLVHRRPRRGALRVRGDRNQEVAAPPGFLLCAPQARSHYPRSVSSGK
jgi:hypothetical protein